MPSPTNSPVAWIAVKTICIVRPSAAPIRNWFTMIHTPIAENTVTCGIGPSVGATMIVMNEDRPIFTRVDTDALPNTGPVATSARIRTSGHKNAAIHVFSCA
jgi:hypothetical protein